MSISRPTIIPYSAGDKYLFNPDVLYFRTAQWPITQFYLGKSQKNCIQTAKL